MSDDAFLSALVAELAERHRCHTIFLYGSRARGDATAESDWDLAAISADGPAQQEVRVRDGRRLDLFLYAEADFEKLDEGSLRLRGSVILRDEREFGRALVERLDALHARGPVPLTAEERANRHAWYEKILARVRRDDPEAHYRRAWLLFDALESWFRVRARWYPGPKQALLWLERHDPAAFALFQEALRPGAQFAAIEALAQHVLDAC